MKTLLLIALLTASTAQAERAYICKPDNGEYVYYQEAGSNCKPANVRKVVKESLYHGYKKQFPHWSERELRQVVAEIWKDYKCGWAEVSVTFEN